MLFVIILFFLSSCEADDPEISKISEGIGVFGGSISSLPESEIAKDIWRKELNLKVTTHGIGGAGFTISTKNNILQQIAEAPVYDIYILWASTNDTKGATVGNIGSMDLSTQNGAINKCISLIRERNGKAQIFFFISLPTFDNNQKLASFVQGQKEICTYLKIPYLDQFNMFDVGNCQNYYYEDRVHLRESGYAKIAPFQVKFLSENIQENSK